MKFVLILLFCNLCSIYGYIKVSNRSRNVILNAKSRPKPMKGLSHLYDEEIRKLTFPAIISSFMEPLAVNLESLFVGRYALISGSRNLAILSLSTSLVRLTFYSLKGITQSATTLIGQSDNNSLSRKLNRKFKNDREDKQLLVDKTNKYSLILGCIISTIMIFSGRYLLNLFGANNMGSENLENVINKDVLTYFRIRALAAPAVLFVLANEGISRGSSDTTTPLIATAIGVIFQVLILSNMPFFLLLNISETAVAAVAALASSIASAAFYVYIKNKRKNAIRISNSSTSRSDERNDLANTDDKNGGFCNDRVIDKQTQSILFSNSLLFVKNIALMVFWARLASLTVSSGLTIAATHQVVLSMWILNCLLHEGLGCAAQVMYAKYPNLRTHSLRSKFNKFALWCGLLEILSLSLTRIVWPKVAGLSKNAGLEMGSTVTSLIPTPALISTLLLPITSITVVNESMLLGMGNFRLLAISVITSTLSSFWLAAKLTSPSSLSNSVISFFSKLGSRVGIDIVDAATEATTTGIGASGVWIGIMAMFVQRLVVSLIATWRPTPKISGSTDK